MTRIFLCARLFLAGMVMLIPGVFLVNLVFNQADNCPVDIGDTLYDPASGHNVSVVGKLRTGAGTENCKVSVRYPDGVSSNYINAFKFDPTNKQ
jgi:hypothetical protein